MPAPRADLGLPGMHAIEQMREPSRSIALAADALLRKTVKGAESTVKWGNPVYAVTRGKGPKARRVTFAALIATKAGINLALPGATLDDPAGLLQGTGKAMRHVKVHDVALLGQPALRTLVRQAASIGFAKM